MINTWFFCSIETFVFNFSILTNELENRKNKDICFNLFVKIRYQKTKVASLDYPITEGNEIKGKQCENRSVGNIYVALV